MAKYGVIFKIKVAKEALRGAASLGEVARRHGLDPSMVRRWRDAYQLHGRAGLSRQYMRYDTAFKMGVLRRIKADGLSHRQATALFNIRHAGLIGIWQRQYDLDGLGALEPAKERRQRMRNKPSIPKPDEELTREELLKEVAYLRAETAYLKKLDALILEEQTATRGKKRKPSKG